MLFNSSGSLSVQVRLFMIHYIYKHKSISEIIEENEANAVDTRTVI